MDSYTVGSHLGSIPNHSEVPGNKLLGLSGRMGGGGGYNPRNSCTPLGVEHWLAAVAVVTAKRPFSFFCKNHFFVQSGCYERWFFYLCLPTNIVGVVPNAQAIYKVVGLE